MQHILYTSWCFSLQSPHQASLIKCGIVSRWAKIHSCGISGCWLYLALEMEPNSELLVTGKRLPPRSWFWKQFARTKGRRLDEEKNETFHGKIVILLVILTCLFIAICRGPNNMCYIVGVQCIFCWINERMVCFSFFSHPKW